MILTNQCACGQKIEFEAEDLPQLACPHCGRSLREQFAPKTPRVPGLSVPPVRSVEQIAQEPAHNADHDRQTSLADVRKRSCYKTLRSLIETVIVIGYAICGLIPFGVFLGGQLTNASLDLQIRTVGAALVIGALIAILLTALKEAMLLGIDGVDVLIAERSDRQAAERARRELSAKQFEESLAIDPTGK